MVALEKILVQDPIRIASVPAQFFSDTIPTAVNRIIPGFNFK